MYETQPETGQEPTASLDERSIARRRMLLASLGKGTAVVAAVSAPMHSLAGTSVISTEGTPSKRCTISGVMSAVHSGETTASTCFGKSSTYYYQDVNRFPSSQTYTKNTPFNNVFAGGSSNKLKDCTGDERNWVTALLNSLPNSSAQNFPYSTAQVIAFYKASASEKSKALAFFKGYMETHN